MLHSASTRCTLAQAEWLCNSSSGVRWWVHSESIRWHYDAVELAIMA